MKDPFIDIEKAFEPFFVDEIVATTKTGETQTLTVYVSDCIEGEPIDGENMIETDRRDIQINARQGDWYFLKRLKRGDTIKTKDGTKFKIAVVKNDDAMGIIIKAREVK